MRKLLIFALCTTLSIGLYAQKDFYGTIEYTYDISGENAESMKMFMPTGMTIMYAKNKMATEMSGGMMNQMGRIVVNDGEAFVVSEANEAIYMMTEEEMKAAEEETDQVQAATLIEGETLEILGYTCQKYKMVTKMQDEETTQYIWATPELQAPDIEQPAGASLAKGVLGDANVDGLPLMVVVDMPNGDMTMTLKATELKAGDVPGEAFEKPDGYEVKPFSEMMK